MKRTHSAKPGLFPLAITVDRDLTEAEGKLFHAILEGAPPHVFGLHDTYPDPDPETGLAGTLENKFDQLTDVRLWFPIYDDLQWEPCCRSQGLANTEENRLKINRMLRSQLCRRVTPNMPSPVRLEKLLTGTFAGKELQHINRQQKARFRHSLEKVEEKLTEYGWQLRRRDATYLDVARPAPPKAEHFLQLTNAAHCPAA